MIVHIIVNEKGLVEQEKVIRSPGPEFDAPALAAIRQYRFSPAMHDKQAVPCEMQVTISFRHL